jgi:hypothetical protein
MGTTASVNENQIATSKNTQIAKSCEPCCKKITTSIHLPKKLQKKLKRNTIATSIYMHSCNFCNRAIATPIKN